MTKHYILKLDPNAKYDWDRCSVRDPITAHRPELADLIAEAVGETPGSYLISVNIEVKVLEQVPGHQTQLRVSSGDSEKTPLSQRIQLQEMVA